MKAKLVKTSLLGIAGVGLWQLNKSAERDELAQLERLNNPQSQQDCWRSELILKGLGGANCKDNLDECCQRRLELKTLDTETKSSLKKI